MKSISPSTVKKRKSRSSTNRLSSAKICSGRRRSNGHGMRREGSADGDEEFKAEEFKAGSGGRGNRMSAS